MSTPRRLAALAVALLALPLAAPAQGNLDKVLAQMDQAAPKFQSFQADLEWDEYQRVIRDTDKEFGTFYCQRGKNGSAEMGIHFTKPAVSILQYKNGIGDKYIPEQNQDDRFKIAGAEGFLALGCGGTGKDLAKAWTITDQGPETVTIDGKPVVTEKLDLVSKDPTVGKNVSHITLWMDAQRGVAMKQIIYQPSGDYRTSIYTHLRFNTSVDTKAYAIPKNAKVIVH